MKNYNPTKASLISKTSNKNHHGLIAATSLSSLNHTNSTSFSVLSNYSDSTNQAMSGSKIAATVSNGLSKYPIKKSYIAFGAQNSNSFHSQKQQVIFPKLSNSNNSLQYLNYAQIPNQTVYHQHHHPSPTMHNIYAKISNFSASILPDLYRNRQFIESKIFGSGSRLNSKY